MKKIYYFMNVDINWIKQRPHFIAEKLKDKYDLVLFYPYFYNRKVLVNNDLGNKIAAKKIFRVPNAINWNLLKNVFEIITSFYIHINIFFGNPDILFICSPDQAKYIPHNYSGKVIYDCMDNLVALARNSTQKEKVYENEHILMEKSNYVLVTSNELKKVVLERYNDCLDEKKVYLCRNAFNGPIVSSQSYKNKMDSIYRIGYFGTVSTWFDFKAVLYSLEKLTNVEIHIAGPVVDGVIIPNNDNIKYHGIVKHNDLESFVANMDCLIMPFEVNEIIKSVDPVKLYEYINFNKNIISVFYEEVSHFSDFVHFYDTKEKLVECIKYLMDCEKVTYSNEERISFLSLNNWSSRCKQIESIIEGDYD